MKNLFICLLLIASLFASAKVRFCSESSSTARLSPLKAQISSSYCNKRVSVKTLTMCKDSKDFVHDKSFWYFVYFNHRTNKNDTVKASSKESLSKRVHSIMR
jgi:hypothetical protein